MEENIAVIFTSKLKKNSEGYSALANRMMELVKNVPGFIRADSVRDKEGFGITVSYWENRAAVDIWRKNEEHIQAKKLGKTSFYEFYDIKICSCDKK